MEKEYERRTDYSFVEIGTAGVDVLEVGLKLEGKEEPQVYYLLLNERKHAPEDPDAYYVPAVRKIDKQGRGKIDHKLAVIKFGAGATVERGEILQGVEAIMKSNIRRELLTDTVWEQYRRSEQRRKIGGFAAGAAALIAGTVATIAIIKHKKGQG